MGKNGLTKKHKELCDNMHSPNDSVLIFGPVLLVPRRGGEFKELRIIILYSFTDLSSHSTIKISFKEVKTKNADTHMFLQWLLTLSLPVTRICVNYSTVYNDTLVAKGLTYYKVSK